MPKYDVGFIVRTWISTPVIAKTREAAEARAEKKAKELMNSNGFEWLGGEVEQAGTTNLSLLNKIPF
jgi:hypothetical protein